MSRIRIVDVQGHANRRSTDRLGTRRSEFGGFGRDAKMVASDLEYRDLATVWCDQAFVVFDGVELPTHRLDFVEVYAKDHHDTRMIPDEVDFMIAFVVGDIREAMAEVQTAGLELVGEPVWAAEAFADPTLEGFAWFFVRAPDGRVYVIQQVPD